MSTVSSAITWDGVGLRRARGAPGRRLRADPRCFGDGGTGVPAYANVCALPDHDARLPFDEPEVQQARRDALSWWIPLLGDAFVCVTTLAADAVHYAGAITVATDPRWFELDPFARLFPGTVVTTSHFTYADPPAGPVIERKRGVAWPGGRF